MAVETVRELRREAKGPTLAYFYCTSRDPSGQDITILLRLLLLQLCNPPTVPAAIQELYDACHDGFPPKVPIFKELLRTLLNAVRTTTASDDIPEGSQTFLLIDGLDEIPWGDRDPTFAALHELAGLGLRHLRLLVTSRIQPDIQSALSDPTSWVPIVVAREMVQADIKVYVENAIKSHPRLARLPGETKQAILVRLVDEGQGM